MHTIPNDFSNGYFPEQGILSDLRRMGAIRQARTPPITAVRSCGHVKDAVTVLSFTAGTTAGATSRTRTTYSVANFAAATSTMLPYAAGSFFFCRCLLTSDPNSTA